MRVCVSILLIVLVSACSEKNKNSFIPSTVKKQPLKLQRINKFQLHSKRDTLILARLRTHFKISPDGSRMAFYDTIFRHIIVSNENGKILYIVGRKGKGPSEFVRVMNWGFDEYNNLIAYDGPQRLLKIFGPQGNLKWSLNLSTSEYGFYITRGNLFAHDSTIYMGIIQSKYSAYGGSGSAAKSKMVAAFDYNGHLVKTIAQYDPHVDQAPMYVKRPLFDIDFANHTLYSIQKMGIVFKFLIYVHLKEPLILAIKAIII